MKSKTGTVTQKRILAMLLCMVMMVSLAPTAAFATAETPENTIVSEKTIPEGTTLEGTTPEVKTPEGKKPEETSSEGTASKLVEGPKPVEAPPEPVTPTYTAQDVTDMQTAIDALPTVAQLSAMDMDSDEFYDASDYIAAADGQLQALLDVMTAEEQTAFKAEVGAERITKLEALKEYLESLSGGIMTLEGGSTITVTCAALGAEQTTWDLMEDTDEQFTVAYTRGSGTEETVKLRVELPEYAATFLDYPTSTTNTSIKSVDKIDNHTIDITMVPGFTGTFTLQLTMATTGLTQAQCEKWMDDGFLPESPIKVTEYFGTWGDESTLGATCEYGHFSPTNYSSNQELKNSSATIYDLYVPAVADVQNLQLSTLFYDNSYWNRAMMYNLDRVHVNDSPLVEIESLKFYVPDERLELYQYNPVFPVDTSYMYNPKSFEISELQTDENGLEYYLVTPKDGLRLFNNCIRYDSPTYRTNAVSYMLYNTLLWKLKDDSDPLPSDTSTNHETLVYTQGNIEIQYKIPSGSNTAAEQTYEHENIKIHVYPSDRVDQFENMINPYNEIDDENHAVYTDSTYSKWEYTAIKNWQTVQSVAGNNVYHYPEYDGPVEEHFQFPYEIQPTSIELRTYLNENYKQTAGYPPIEDRMKLGSVTYTVTDGTMTETKTIAQDDIDAFNQAYYTYNSSIYYVDSFGFDITDGSRVSDVKVYWDSVYYDLGQKVIPFGMNSSSKGYNVKTLFDFDTPAENEDGEPIPNNTDVRVKYDLDCVDDPSQSYTDTEDYLWFTLIAPECPILSEYGSYLSKHTDEQYMYGADHSTPIGSIGYRIDQYGAREDIIKYPVIELFGQNSDQKRRALEMAANNINSMHLDTGMDEEDMLMFLTGEFTATKWTSGWTFAYTVLDKDGNESGVRTWTCDPITEDTVVQIPKGADEYFHTMRLYYNGEFDTAHESKDDPTRSIDLMKNVMVYEFRENPITEDPLIPFQYSYDIQCAWDFELWGRAWSASCNEANKQHDTTVTDNGNMVFENGMPLTRGAGQLAEVGPYEFLGVDVPAAMGTSMYYYELARLQQYGRTPDKTVAETPTVVYQNSSTARTITVHAVANYTHQLIGDQRSPWDICETLYVELIDPEFILDANLCNVGGFTVANGKLAVSTVQVDGRTFVKLERLESAGRKNPYDSVPGQIWLYGPYGSGANTTYVSNAITIGLYALPGATEGIHGTGTGNVTNRPVFGEVYGDYSQILLDYNAPYGAKDDGKTKWYFEGAVEDTLGLSDTEATGEKLFAYDMSDYQLNVQLASNLGISLYPGLNDAYELSDLTVDFLLPQKDNLDGLFSVTGDKNYAVNNVETVITIPKKGTSVNYFTKEGLTETATSEYDMFLDGPVNELNNTITGQAADNVTYTYSTDGGNSYVAASAITDWKKVTHVKQFIAVLPADSAVNIHLDLSATEKSELGTQKAYASATTKMAMPGTAEEKTLTTYLSTYQYNDYEIYGSVFYDNLNENGTKDNNNTFEPWAQNIKVGLYAADGETLIEETTTSSVGTYTLHTLSPDAGQIVRITMPDTDDATYKLTKQSNAVFTTAYTDSDFDRATNEFVLPKLNAQKTNNLSAGLVRLPKLVADDVEVIVGGTVDIEAILTDYFGNDLPEDSFNITFGDTEDSDIATIDLTTNGATVVTTGKPATSTGSRTVTGVAVGKTYVTITTKNTLGDEVSVRVKITVTTSTIDVPVVKAWNDAGVVEGIRPESVTLQLWRNIEGGEKESVGSAVDIGEDAGWSHTFEDVEEFDTNGNEYIYSVTEEDIDGNYTAEYSATAGVEHGITVTNSLNYLTIEGTKTWSEIGTNWNRPSTLTINLFRNDNLEKPIESVEITAPTTEEGVNVNQWSYSFGTDKKLLRYDADGNEYVYTVAEETVPVNYNAEVNGYNITNTYPAKQYFKVTKTWDEGVPENHPTKVEVTLVRDGDENWTPTAIEGITPAIKATLQGDEWTYEFGIAQADSSGHTFTVKETPIGGYVAQYSGVRIDDETHVTLDISNSYAPKPVKLDVTFDKEIDGNPATDSTFRFKLTASTAGAPMPGSGTGTSATASIVGAGKVDFGSIEFKLPGTYKYTIKEIDGDVAGYTYDTTVYTAVVEVTDVNGELQTDVSITKSGETAEDPDVTVESPVITNKYAPTPVTYRPSVTKTISGDTPLTEETFEFTLTAVTAGAPMPEGEGNKATSEGIGNATFGEISFTEPGEWVYKIKETIPDPVPEGFTYDTTEYTLTIEVVDVKGKLKAVPTVTKPAETEGEGPVEVTGGISFVNQYAVQRISVSGTKTWVGITENYPDAIFDLWQNNSEPSENDTPYDTIILSDGTANFEFADLPLYDDRGDEISYTVTEREIAGFATANEGTDFTNTKVSPVTMPNGSIKLIKTIAGNDLPEEKGFSFELERIDGGAEEAVVMPAVTTVSVAPMTTGSSEQVTFGDIVFNLPGTYTFTVTEVDPRINKMTLAQPQTVTVEVAVDGTDLTATITDLPESGQLEFVNTYEPAPAPITDAELNIVKTLEGNELSSTKTFTFTIARTDEGDEDAVTMPGELSTTTAAISTGSADAVGFDDIVFNAAGIYTFTVTETASDVNGMVDAEAQDVTVTVTDNAGVLSAAITAPDGGGALEFVNTYTPTSATITDENLTVKSTITGGTLPTATDFDYSLALTTGDTTGVTMPDDTDLTSPNEIATGSTTAIGFDDLVFTKPGTYTFTASQTDPSIPGLTAASAITVTIVVNDNDGELEASITVPTTGGNLEFVNTYSPTAAKITSTALNVTKKVAGTPLTTAKAFEFTLARTDNGAAANVTMPTTLTATTSAIKFGSADAVGFGDITFNAAGTYTFSITETASGVTGITDAAAQTVTVTVTDTAGVLSASVTTPTAGGALTFVNTYAPTPVPADPPVRKEISGDKPVSNDTFNFRMEAVSYTGPMGSTQTLTPTQMPMPAGSTNGVKTASVSGEGNVEFGTYNYTSAGVYVYKITETAGSNALYTYDDTEYTITDTVVDNGGTLSLNRVISGGATVCLFTNDYTRPLGELTISKTVTGDLASKTQEFTFTLKLSEEGTFNYTGSKSGTISNGGTLTLKHGESVTISLPSGMTYTVTESNNSGYTVTATGDKGTIPANGKATAAFTNTKSSVPKTGDDNTVRNGLATMLASLTGMLGLAIVDKTVYGKRRKKEDR